MGDSAFKLISDLVKNYLASKLGPSPSAIVETLTTNTHTQWTLHDPPNTATVTATKLSDENTILNFVSGDVVRAVQVNLRSIGVDDPASIDNISPFLADAFATFVDRKLSQQGGFWQAPPARQEGKMDNRELDKSSESLGNLHISDQQLPGPSRPTRPSDMPDFDDEYELKSRASPAARGGVFAIGESDLNPPGLSRDPLVKPYIDPLAGVPGGGMHPGADHPIFGRRDGNTSRLGVPPGARFDDPYGEDNLDDMGMGLPGNLRRPGGPPGGGPAFGGSMGGSFGGSPFGGNFGGSGGMF